MMVKNSWIGVGRITKDIEVKVTQSGKKVISFDIAIDEGTKEKPFTNYIPLEAWDKTAEIIANHFHKGDQIIVGARAVNRKYVDRGENRYKISMVVDSFEWGAKKENKEIKKDFRPDDVKDFDYPWEQ